MSQKNLQSLIVIVPARKMLKHLYKPKNICYRIAYIRLTDKQKTMALLSLTELGCINLINDTANISNLKNTVQLNLFGSEVAELVIEEDRRYWIPNILSIIAIIAAFLPYIFNLFFSFLR